MWYYTLSFLFISILYSVDELYPFSTKTDFPLIRKVLVMDYIDGIPILRLGDEMAKRGVDPSGRIAAAAKQ